MVDNICDSIFSDDDDVRRAFDVGVVHPEDNWLGIIDVEEDTSGVWGTQKVFEWGILCPNELENSVGEIDECLVSFNFTQVWLATGRVDERQDTQYNRKTH
ncbi:hypothetical protein FIBSPDRAFT_863968 [Athelia psychrophila]|uniref:Uncharacterized protein n=1 Tax=Athelia psychrophila TaxID=1759441 RepID=A0A166GY65_9AGAM|nr:hypothetical protein FIBSPDRAFT_863968 [Fibularhizoctonia sp. CBS 109695]